MAADWAAATAMEGLAILTVAGRVMEAAAALVERKAVWAVWRWRRQRKRRRRRRRGRQGWRRRVGTWRRRW